MKNPVLPFAVLVVAVAVAAVAPVAARAEPVASGTTAEPVAPAATNELRFVVLPEGRTTVDGIPLFSREGAERLAAATNAAATAFLAEAGEGATVGDLDAVEAAAFFAVAVPKAKRDDVLPEFCTILFDGLDVTPDGEGLYPVWFPALVVRLGREDVLVGGIRFSRGDLGPRLGNLPDAFRRASNLADGCDRPPPVFCYCGEDAPLAELLAVRRTAAGLGYGRFLHAGSDVHCHAPKPPSLSDRVWDRGQSDGEWWRAAEDEP